MDCYKFRGNRYHTLPEMLDAVAAAWMSGNGCNSPPIIAAMLRDTPAFEHANDCIAVWSLDRDEDQDDGKAHMERYGYDKDDLAAAFERLRLRA
jgi:hypothetical protein